MKSWAGIEPRTVPHPHSPILIFFLLESQNFILIVCFFLKCTKLHFNCFFLFFLLEEQNIICSFFCFLLPEDHKVHFKLFSFILFWKADSYFVIIGFLRKQNQKQNYFFLLFEKHKIHWAEIVKCCAWAPAESNPFLGGGRDQHRNREKQLKSGEHP